MDVNTPKQSHVSASFIELAQCNQPQAVLDVLDIDDRPVAASPEEAKSRPR
jgi:hypothetical protein